MNLNITRNVNTPGVNQIADIASSGLRPAANGGGEPSCLTITHAIASSEDIAAAGISDAALLRDDALGRLVNEAFGLPPPPMPDFSRM